MKKNLIFTLGLFFAMTTLFTACGGEDTSEADAKAKADSIRKADSLAAIALADSLYQDSLKKATDSLAAALDAANSRPVRSSGSSEDGGIVIKKIDNPKANTEVATPNLPTQDKPKTGKDAVKDNGGTTTSGKDAVKGGTTTGGKKGGKLDVKKGG